jgi:uncharacterized protein
MDLLSEGPSQPERRRQVDRSEIAPELGRTPLGTMSSSGDSAGMWIDQRGSEVLPVAECLRLLAVAAKEEHVGRLAINEEQSPLVVPLNFTFHDRGVLIRIGPGRLSELVPGSLVAFEVDRMSPEAGEAWSVLVRGLASVVAPDDAPHNADVVPQPWVPEPGAQLIFIRPDVVTGRRFPLVAQPVNEVSEVNEANEGAMR